QCSCQTLVVQPFTPGRGQWGDLAHTPAEQLVGELRITRQCGPVQVGTQDLPLVSTFRPFVVADASHKGRQRTGRGADGGAALVVLEAGDPAAPELWVDVCDEFTDRPGPTTVTTDVEDPHPREGEIGRAKSELQSRFDLVCRL